MMGTWTWWSITSTVRLPSIGTMLNRYPDHHYLRVELKGSELNQAGIGARVNIYSGGRQQMVQNNSPPGDLCPPPPITSISDWAAIPWLIPLHPLARTAGTEAVYGIRANQILALDISNGSAFIPDEELADPDSSIFSSITGTRTGVQAPGKRLGGPGPGGTDSRQPFRRRAGPGCGGCEWGRTGGSLCGWCHRPGLQAIYTELRKELSLQLLILLLLRDRYTEDVDAAFFDADGDGDQDLYVVRGGSEEFAGSPILADRLLINDGQGHFEHSRPGSIPLLMQNGSCVRPADFDGDGDMDLFLGTTLHSRAPMALARDSISWRMTDRAFSPRSRRKDSGTLYKAGMVTDACWFDHDQDGDPDLVVVGEWMNVSLFINDEGKLRG